MKKLKYIGEIILIVILAAIGALNYAIFIFPNKFAPAGLDGLCTMLQDLTGINIGYTSLLINLPLLIVAFFHLDRDYAIKNIAFILSFSAVSAILGKMDLSAFYFYTETSTSVVLAPVVAGVIRGLLYAFTLGLNGASGGIDIIAALVRKNHPHLNLMNIIFAINMFVAVCSYFVYGNQLVPVICGMIYFYITSQTSTQIQASIKENAKIEIITNDANPICTEIVETLHLSATVMDSHGAYSENANTMVVCIAHKKYIPLIKDIIQKFPNTIYFVSTICESNAHRY